MKTIHANGRPIGDGHPTFIIAEVGINHNGQVGLAERLIDAAARAGADAVKFQTYVTEQRVPRSNPIFDVLKRCEISFSQQARLKEYAEQQGLLFFSTPFDLESVAFLQSLGVGLYKIASFDLVNLQLLRAVAATGAPVVVSRGMATAEEIDTAVGVLKMAGSLYALLHCISAYPTPEESANLNVIRTLAQRYGCPVGYSDHTVGIDVPVYAVAVGAQLIEKHFTLDRHAEGPDHAMSADPSLLAELVRRIRSVERILGHAELRAYEVEQATLVYRRVNQ